MAVVSAVPAKEILSWFCFSGVFGGGLFRRRSVWEVLPSKLSSKLAAEGGACCPLLCRVTNVAREELGHTSSGTQAAWWPAVARCSGVKLSLVLIN